MEAPPSPLSSRPKRSEVRDLLFRPSHEPMPNGSTALPFVIPTEGRDLQFSGPPMEMLGNPT
jgi:hypothetical protein